MPIKLKALLQCQFVNNVFVKICSLQTKMDVSFGQAYGQQKVVYHELVSDSN